MRVVFYLFVPVITHNYTSLSLLTFSSLYLCPSVHNHSHMFSACRASRPSRRLSSLSPFHPHSLYPLSCHYLQPMDRAHEEEKEKFLTCVTVRFQAEEQSESPAGLKLTTERKTWRELKSERETRRCCIVWSVLIQLFCC